MTKHIHIYVHPAKTPTRDAGEWEESKHPRAENGQFGKGSGGGKKADPKNTPAKPSSSNRQAELREMGSPRATGLRENPVKAHREQQSKASGGHQPGSHQYHQAKADEMRGMSRPYSSEHANLQLTTLHHHQNAANALKRLENAQGTEFRRQLKEQADFHMKGAAEGEKQMQAAGLLKNKKPINGGSNGGGGMVVNHQPSGATIPHQAPPTSINHGGVKHTATGKSGTHTETGEAMHEYEAVNAEGRRTGSRVWRTARGKVIPD